jgi:phage terminase large subunit-like protein
VDFIDNWHFGAKAEILTAVSKRQIKRLVINEPPGMGKTLTVDVLWPAWHWATIDPKHAWMSISFDYSLVLRNARQLLEVLASRLYREAYPEFKLGGVKSAIGEFFNGHGGYRFSTSFDGKGTGRHVHTQVCDDPLKPKDEHNHRALEAVLAKWNGTFSNRAVSRPEFARVIIMQRVADNDLSGEMLRDHGYEHLCLPMRYVPGAYWDLGNSAGVTDQRTVEGELLFPARMNAEETDKAERELGIKARVEAQHQQNPVPDIGGVVERSWIECVWSELPKDARLFQSWDFGFKALPGASPQAELIRAGRSRVHGGLFADLTRNGVERAAFVDEIKPEALSFPESRRTFLGAQRRELWNRAQTILIEDKANGTGIVDDLKDLLRQALEERRSESSKLAHIVQRISLVEPDGDKLTRLIRHTEFLRQGGLLIPSETACPTIEDWKIEVVGFPLRRWDDRIDTLTQALDRIRGAVSRYRAALARMQLNRSRRS